MNSAATTVTRQQAAHLVDQLRRFPHDVLPVGLLKQVACGGAEVERELIRRLTMALDDQCVGVGSQCPESFFCYASLISYPSIEAFQFVQKLVALDENRAGEIVGELREKFTSHLLRSIAASCDAPPVVDWLRKTLASPSDRSATMTAARSTREFVEGGFLTRAEAIQMLIQTLQLHSGNPDQMLDLYIVRSLEQMGAVEACEAVREVFEAGRITDDIMDFEDFKQGVRRADDDRTDDSTLDSDFDAADFLQRWSFSRIALDPNPDVLNWTFNHMGSAFTPREDEQKPALLKYVKGLRASNDSHFPRQDFRALRYQFESVQNELLQEVQVGIERLETERSRETNAPFLSLVLLLAGDASVPPETLLQIFDLDPDSKLDLVGDAFDDLLAYGLSNALRGNVEPIMTRLRAPQRNEFDWILLAKFFVYSAHHGYLTRDEAIAHLWQLHEQCSDSEFVAAAIFELLCVMSRPQDRDRLNQMIDADFVQFAFDADQCRKMIASSEIGVEWVQQQIKEVREPMSHVRSSVMFDRNLIDPPPPATSARNLQTPQTIRNDGNRTPHRNDPCHCGSGKKYKKCCMRSGG